MSFSGDLETHEQVVLIHHATGRVVDARVSRDTKLALGLSAMLEVAIVTGLPVESAVVNVNCWDVYRLGDTKLAEILLDRVFANEKENNE